MIKFTARGYDFKVPYNYILENIKEGSLLRNLAQIPENLVEKIDGNIFVDINPVHIKDILSHIFKKGLIHNESIDDELYRELCYTLVIDENIDEWLTVPLNENNGSQYEDSYTHLEPKNKIITIHTYNKKKIILPYSTIIFWKKCFLRDIVSGQSEIYFISGSDNTIDVWIDIDYKICNQLISIMRDGINVNYKVLDNLILKKHIVYYGLYTEKELTILSNRVKRMMQIIDNIKREEKRYSHAYKNNENVYEKIIDIKNLRAHCFNQDIKKTGVYSECVNNWDKGTNTRAQFHNIRDREFGVFMKNIEDYKMTITKEVNYIGFESYNETIWKYTLNAEDMTTIENYYFRYLMGYID